MIRITTVGTVGDIFSHAETLFRNTTLAEATQRKGMRI